jgi:hypothetical protein
LNACAAASINARLTIHLQAGRSLRHAMAFNYNHVSTKKLFVGASGFGKTTGAMQWVAQSKYRYYFIFDHDGQFANRNKLKAAYSPDELLRQLKEQRFVIFNPQEMFVDMQGDADLKKKRGGFDWFCAWAFTVSEKIPKRIDGTKLLYADEIQDICKTSKIGLRAQQMITSGRNRSLDFVGAGVQINLVHNCVLAGVSHLYVFRTEEKNAVKDLIDRGFDAQEIMSLPKGAYVMRDNAGGWQRGRIF